MRPTAALLVLGALAALPWAAAHGNEPHLDDQLVENGEKLLVGSFTAAQEGPLLIVAHTDGELGCDAPEGQSYRLALREDAGVSFAANDEVLAAYFDVPAGGEGYVGFAVDTNDASRTLIMMQENAVALHALVGVLPNPPERLPPMRTGVLGIPYVLPGSEGHDMGDFTPEGGGIQMAHDDSFPDGGWCPGAQAGHVALRIPRASLPDSLGAGSVVHVVALHDRAVAGYLPRPLDDTTSVLQANLYLAREGEEPAQIRAALDPRLDVLDLVPLVLLGVGLVWVSRR